MTRPQEKRDVVDADAAAVAAAAAGDAAAFDALVAKYQRRVLNTCWRYVGDAEAARDAAQNVFVKAWLGLPKFRRQAAFASWLYRIAVNECLNLKASRARRRTEPLDELTPDPAADPEQRRVRDERARLVRAALDALPPKQRVALILSAYEGLSYREIAAALETSVPAVESLLFRAKQNLATTLAPLRARGDL
jgi:RNA polymerase sigma-70 factor (ECF subfamily)